MLKLPLPRARDIDHPVHDNMRHVHALGPELPGERLRQRAQGKLAGRERRERGRALEACCCAGEDEGGWVGQAG